MSQRRGRTPILVEFLKIALVQNRYQNLYCLNSGIVVLELPDSRTFKNSEDWKPFIEILKDYTKRTTRRCITEKDYNETKQAIFAAIRKSSQLIICGPKERNKVKFRFIDIKPELLDPPMSSPVAGPSHSTDNSMMMYIYNTVPGPSGYQDNGQALVPADSQPQAEQGFDIMCDQGVSFSYNEGSSSGDGGSSSRDDTSEEHVLSKAEQGLDIMSDQGVSFSYDESSCSSGYGSSSSGYESSSSGYGSGSSGDGGSSSGDDTSDEHVWSEDVEPELLDPPMSSPVAGPSHSTDNSMMMYIYNTVPGPSGYQENSQALIPADSQPQGQQLEASALSDTEMFEFFLDASYYIDPDFLNPRPL